MLVDLGAGSPDACSPRYRHADLVAGAARGPVRHCTGADVGVNGRSAASPGSALAYVRADGVRVNLNSPGYVEGDRLDRAVSAQATAQSRPPDQVRTELTAASPLRPLRAPADAPAVAARLPSDAAAGVTGEDVNVSFRLVMF